MARMKRLLDEYIDSADDIQQAINPTLKSFFVIDKWHIDNSDQFQVSGINTREMFNGYIEQLTNVFNAGTATELNNTIAEIAHTPHMTNEVMQELIFMSARKLSKSNIIALDKVAITLN